MVSLAHSSVSCCRILPTQNEVFSHVNTVVCSDAAVNRVTDKTTASEETPLVTLIYELATTM